MSEVLQPYTEFEASDLAVQLHGIVVASEQELRARNLLGVLERYGRGMELAEHNVRKGQHDANPDHFAVVNEAGNVVGSASAYRGLPLRKLHLPLPGLMAVLPFAEPFPYANPNIHAWTKTGEEEVLVGAYRQLAEMNMKPKLVNEPHDSPWTIEPTRSPRYVHTAIAMAGLTKVATRRFYDGENHRQIPPRSTLYVKSSTEWATAHGRQKEVRTGQWKSGWQEWDEEDREYAARYINPRG